MNKKSRMKFIWPSILVMTLLMVSLGTYLMFRPGDLEDWSAKSNRPSLLTTLLNVEHDKLQSSVEAKALPSDSPIYEWDENRVTALLGNPDENHPSVLVYEVGNVTASYVGNFIVPQNARLYLIFIDGKCVKYRLET